MALQQITDAGDLSWQCLMVDKDGELLSCGQLKSAHADEARYVTLADAGKGATIVLPQCSCGAQCSLKADYTLKELWQLTQRVVNTQGQVWAYVLPLIHVRNLRLHARLYAEGRADAAPVLPMPAPALLAQPRWQALGDDKDVAHALWFGFCAMREYAQTLPARKRLQIEQEKGRGGLDGSNQ